MSRLGSPQTNEFRIGTAELRIGPLSEAGRLAQSRSVGLVDNVTLGFAVASVDLKGLFPQVIVDTAITEQTGSVKASAREYSARNLDIMLGNAVGSGASPTDVKTTLATTADVAANATSVTVASAAGLAADDVIVIYPDGKPEDVTVTQILSIATNVLTLKTGMGTVVAYPALTDSTRQYIVFKAFAIAAGNVTKTNYFSMMLLQQKNVNGRPLTWHIWKGANTGSFEQASSATDYGTLNMEFKVLQATAADTGVGGPLETMKPLIDLYPMGGCFGGADA
jgi:hypothetical protein